jgi:hypothetical protein
MLTNKLFVFLFECTAEEASRIEPFRLEGLYTSKHDNKEVYRCYYRYYDSFQSAVADLVKLAAEFDYQILYPASKISTSYLLVNINNRFGYLHDVNSAVELLLKTRFEAPLAV